MIYPYSSVAKAIVSLQQKGFDNDFYLSKKTLRCIQSDVRVDDINNKIVEIHPVRINNKRKWVVAIELEDYLLKASSLYLIFLISVTASTLHLHTPELLKKPLKLLNNQGHNNRRSTIASVNNGLSIRPNLILCS
jgi:hypothetical protein